MPRTEAQKKADKKSRKKIYSMFSFIVRHDSILNDDVIREHAATMGESLNAFFNRAVVETIERDRKYREEILATEN